jgi:inosose dehydratase
LAAAWAGFAQEPREKEAKKPVFHLGVQSYTFRSFGWKDALKRTKQVGLEYWEAYPGHLPVATDQKVLDEYRSELKSAGVTLMAYGVMGFTDNAEHNRLYFQFAKQMGIGTISADPAPESLAQLSELVEEFGINIAIHNHGPGARYDKVEDVQKAMEGRHERIGACVDTGHYLRSGVDPVGAIKTFGKRVYGVHLKDFVDKNTEAITGDGKLDIEGVLRALMANDYEGILAIEYEMNPEKVVPDLEKCLANTKAAIAKVG